MSELTASSFLITVMIVNGILTIPFGILAKRAFRQNGALSPALAIWSGIAMHGHAFMTFAAAWLDRGSLYIASPLYWVLGTITAGAGAYLIYLGRKAYGDQTRVYGLREDELITSGIYRRSRNPQYLGYGLMFIGASIATGSGLGFIFVAVFAAMVHAGITLVEEPHLMRVFGAPYAAYRKSSDRYFKIIVDPAT